MTVSRRTCRRSGPLVGRARRACRVGAALLALGASLTPRAGYAEEEDEVSARAAIQRRKHAMSHEVRLGIGAMPLDAFQKGWTGSLSYSVHWNDYVAWEVLNGTFALLTSTDLRDELISTFAVPPEDFAAPRLVLTTGFELSPFYGKQAFLNDDISHTALLFGAYGGLMFGDRGDFGDTLSDVRPTAGLGLGVRVHASKLISLRFDARGFAAFRRAIRANEEVEIDTVLLLQLSASFNLWRDDA